MKAIDPATGRTFNKEVLTAAYIMKRACKLPLRRDTLASGLAGVNRA